LKRLRLAKEFGFNHARHHTHFVNEEYYQACDEMGLLVSAEFPWTWFGQVTEQGRQVQQHQWAAAIKRYRNHPSIVHWSVSNENYEAFADGPLMYRIAKSLDPTRP